MDRKGVLDKIVSSFVIMIPILTVMGLFIFISFLFAELKEPDLPSIASVGLSDSVLLKEIEFDGERYLILDSLFLVNDKERIINRMIEELGKTGDECLLVSSSHDFFLIREDKVHSRNRGQTLPKYLNIGGFIEFGLTVDGKDKFIQYYQGECVR